MVRRAACSFDVELTLGFFPGVFVPVGRYSPCSELVQASKVLMFGEPVIWHSSRQLSHILMQQSFSPQALYSMDHDLQHENSNASSTETSADRPPIELLVPVSLVGIGYFVRQSAKQGEY
jgi:hypothetical protein